MRRVDKINILLLSKNPEIGKSLDSMLTIMHISHKVLIFKNFQNMLTYQRLAPLSPHLLFIDISDGVNNYRHNIKLIKSENEFKEIFLAVYDPMLFIKDIEETFVAGVNIYIHRQDSIKQLQTALKAMVKLGWQFFLGTFNKETCFISL